jgi:transcriptional regulator with XRE-family HTH domain
MEYRTDVLELKKIMLEKNFEKIGSLAEATGIGRDTLSKVLKGKIQPTAETMRRLVATLEIPPEKAGRIFFSQTLRTA